MNSPISLWRLSRTEVYDGGVFRIESPKPHLEAPPPYSHHTQFLEGKNQDPQTYVPSLKLFCIQKLLDYPDCLHFLGPIRMRYECPQSVQEFDILRALIPALRLMEVDPRLWAILIQLYDNLPGTFRTYTLPLYDPHLPLLQQIPSTPHFALVTILDLAGRSEVSDDSITELGRLHGLGALDLSRTAVGSWGIIRLSKMLISSDPEHREEKRRWSGPWGLRVLYLRDCMNMKEDVLEGLNRFPLLSVLDLRGTQCQPYSSEAPESPFRPAVSHELFHPTPLVQVLRALKDEQGRDPDCQSTQFFSHDDPFFLDIHSLQHLRIRSINDTPKMASTHLCLQVLDVASAGSRPRVSAQPAYAFYAPLNPRSATRRSQLPTWNDDDATKSREKRRVKRSSEDTSEGPDLQMLYRPPPCWNALEEAVLRMHTERSQKKPPVNTDSILHGVGARKHMEAKESVKALHDLIERRKTTDGTTPHRPLCTVEVKKNPFSRRNVKGPRMSDVDPGLLASVARDTAKRQDGETRPTVGGVEDFEASAIFGKSTFVLPQPTNKPLKPITSIAVPSLPPSMRVQPKPKPPPPLRKAKSLDGAQMTLHSHFHKTDGREDGKQEADESPMRAEGKAAGSSHQVRNSEGKRTKSKQGGAAFDWKAWGGGPERKKMKVG